MKRRNVVKDKLILLMEEEAETTYFRIAITILAVLIIGLFGIKAYF